MNALKRSMITVRGSGLVRKVRRVLSSRYQRDCAIADAIIGELKILGIDNIRAKHLDNHDSSRKYLTFEEHVGEAVRHAGRLELLDSSGLRILDLGCGAGYFLFACRRSGHETLGLDLPGNPIYDDIIALERLERVQHRIAGFQRLPEFAGPFDLITAFSICFDLHSTPEIWGPGEWGFFIDDCASRLRANGRLFLNFNPATSREFAFIPDETARFLRSIPGGTLSRSKEFFTFRKP